MAHITSKLRGLVAAFVAVFAALALVPGTAFAAYDEGSTVTATISGLQPNDEVKLYQVVNYTYNGGGNVFTWDFTPTDLKTTLNKAGINVANYGEGNVKDALDVMSTYINTHEGLTSFGPFKAGENGVASAAGLPAGQYFVSVSPAQATVGNTHIVYQHALISVVPAQSGDDWSISKPDELDMKSSTVPFDKKVEGDTENKDETDGYGVGDKVPFTITTTIPNYPVETDFSKTTITISDTMSKGLVFDQASGVVIKADQSNLTVNVDYGYTSTATSFTITLTGNNLKALQGKDLVVTYNGIVTSDAVQTEPGTNNAKIDYGDNQTIFDQVSVYTYAIDITKKDSASGDLLNGAEFTIYTPAKQGDDGAEQLPDGRYGIKLSADGFTNPVTTTNGTASFADLAAGKYYIVETKAPDAYQLDKTVHEITVSKDDDNTPYNIEVEILNTKTPSLPTTGGPGTVALTAAGVVLIAGAAAFIVRSRKQD